ncbi:MAG: error-prone DNA polymerase, partial [Gammaproteobacteria bacterium]
MSAKSIPCQPAYAELHAVSNFTFLRGGSHPEELVRQAYALGYSALAITDECSLAGVVRAHTAARECGLKLIIGTELTLVDGTRLVLLATDREGYGGLSALITQGRRRAAKGGYQVARSDLERELDRCVAVLIPRSKREGKVPARRDPQAEARWLAETFSGRAWIAVEIHREGDDGIKLDELQQLGRRMGVPLLAAGDVHMHRHSRRALQDTLTAIRLGVSLEKAGSALYPNGERYLHSRAELAALYPAELMAETLAVAERCWFSLDELRYEYPQELVPAGRAPAVYLRELTEAGMYRRWPAGVPDKVRSQIEHELKLIAELRYEPYFLTVHDIVRFARSRNILCQGRGSAANSAVCFCLGITEVDPTRMEILFERFVSKERNEPPDIDVDFEHERREEVVQYIYDKYGRDRAALTATVITYKARSAIRDVGKALGMSLAQVDRLAKNVYWWDGRRLNPERLKEAGFDPENPTIRRLLKLVGALVGFPRHLSQHVGGFVISRGPLERLVPIENAAMPGRTVIQWDKDDLDALGLLKVDCLCLGMLTAIHKAFDAIRESNGKTWSMATVPPEDPETYAMIQRADTMGVFQIESRAQMAMLPRLKPASYYDLVIEVAIIRPGPIQGDMVHPYLRRRKGLEPVSYPSEAVKGVLARTLGVPLFQEQVIKLAMVAAGFLPGEADQLRRSMASWRRNGDIYRFEQRLIEGMCERGYSEAFARRIFQQIVGFGEYGFPESHAASFALLAYVSAWLKCHEPAAFTCALLNSQPMGFYAPGQLVQDARRHGVAVRPVDV